MFGSVSQWFFQWLGGIRPAADAVGFDKILIAPQPCGDLTWATSEYKSCRGLIKSSWKKDQAVFTLKVTIPVGATATVFVKDGEEFVRVSTNVLTPEGKRGVGTTLARAKAYEAVSKGQNYCGDVDVLGTAFNACYNPIKDAGGEVIGVTYTGYKK